MRRKISKRQNKRIYHAGNRVRAINTKVKSKSGERL